MTNVDAVVVVVAALIGGGGVVALIRAPGGIARDRAAAAKLTVETLIASMTEMRIEVGALQAKTAQYEARSEKHEREYAELRQLYDECERHRVLSDLQMLELKARIDQLDRREQAEWRGL